MLPTTASRNTWWDKKYESGPLCSSLIYMMKLSDWQYIIVGIGTWKDSLEVVSKNWNWKQRYHSGDIIYNLLLIAESNSDEIAQQ